MLAADLALLGITLLWGLSFTVTKDLLAAVPPHALLALRFALAALALAALRPRALGRATASVWSSGLGLGVVLYGAFALQTFGLAGTTPSRSAFLTGGYVFLVPLLGFALWRERVGRGVAAGALLATAGLALLTHPETSGGIRRGDVLSALCALGFAVHIVGLGRTAAGVPADALALVQLLAVALLSFVAAAASGELRIDLGASAWAGIAFLALGCSALAYLTQTWAQQRTAASRAAVIFALEPAFAAALSVGLGRERLGRAEAAGALLIVLGLLAAVSSRSPGPESTLSIQGHENTGI